MWKKINNLTDLDKIAQSLISFLLPNTYLLLKGKLGVGKTALTKLIGKNLKIEQEITSPTFSILQQYLLGKNYYLNHFDFFRLSPKNDLTIFADLITNNLNIIE
jgi:tRNA threonylcarbamoyladenosine biosynthesis protein TsaE